MANCQPRSKAQKRHHSLEMKRRWREGTYGTAVVRHHTGASRRKVSRSLKKAYEDPVLRKKLSKGKRKLWTRRNYRIKQSEAQSRKLKKLFCNPEWKAKWQKSQDARTDKGPTFSRVVKRLWKTTDHQEKMAGVLKEVVGRRTSRVQMSIFKSLCRRGCKGVRLNFRCGLKWIDIAFPKRKLAFEIDGAYWHRDRLKQRRRNHFLHSRGWKVVHLPAEFKSVFRIVEMLKCH